MSARHPIHSGAQAIERLPTLPGGPELLAQTRQREDIALVGGAVRDLLLGHWPRELDVTVAADAAGLARALAASVSPSERPYGQPVEPVTHERFGTASVRWGYGRIDVAELRAERYAAPGALPEVRPGRREQDLARRDFTVNAIALALSGPERGELLAVERALEDLAAGRLRVLHERSFIDDPTRILRLARYAARLGFEVEPQTLELAEAALADGALRTVSGGRVGAELLLAAGESDGRASLRMLDELGVLAAAGMPAPFDQELAGKAEALLPHDGVRAALLIAIAAGPAADEQACTKAIELIDELELAGEVRDRTLAAACGASALAEALVGAAAELDGPGAVGALLDGSRVEAAALAGALAARRSAPAVDLLNEWLTRGRHVTLEIDGNDLIAAGVPEGPEVGTRLRRALQRKREGELADREQELRAALEAGPARSEKP